MDLDATAQSECRATTSRRQVLKTGAALGTLLLGFSWPYGRARTTTSETFAPNAFIRIDRRGKVTLVMPQVEMGQGVYTAIAMILAEELSVSLEQVELVHAPPSDALYGNPLFHIQVTGNSNSIRAFWMTLRKAGATARAMLVEAAARRWNVQSTALTTLDGKVRQAGGRELAYGELVEVASGITPPKDAPLKARRDFRLIGRPLKRLDTPGKTTGAAIYGIDVMPPGIKFATLTACPVFGGKVQRVNDANAMSVPGVRQVVALDDLVAVVADHMWAAKQGLAALEIEWAEGANAHVTSAQVWQELREASTKDGAVAKSEGDVEAAMRNGQRLEAAYEMPFLAHAPMEPMNCTVHLTPGACEVWVGSQVLSRCQAVAAKLTGLPLEKVTVHNHLIGGGFGRRLDVDGVEKAVRIAQHVDAPVKVVWTREEDIRQDFYRPVYRDVFSASLENGRIHAWKHRISGSSIMARWLPPAFQHGIDVDAIDSAADIPYEIPNLRVEYVRAEPPAVPTGFWRGVGPNNNVFAIESFVDELARRAGTDPVEFRRSMLGKTPRLKAALELAAAKAGWGSPLPTRTGRGVGVQVAFGSFIATVAEAEVGRDGHVRVRRMVSAVDTGIIVNPDTVIAQIQGGLIFGLTAALYGEITIDKGRVKQGNFNDYRMLRIDETPAIEVYLIDSDEAPGGIGETGTTAAPPALGNAIYAATGVRLRRLPIDRAALAEKNA
jgi:isoquinoline 1-oxidoreductase beta subunit